MQDEWKERKTNDPIVYELELVQGNLILFSFLNSHIQINIFLFYKQVKHKNGKKS